MFEWKPLGRNFSIVLTLACISTPLASKAQQVPYAIGAVQTAASIQAEKVRVEIIQAQKTLEYNRLVLHVRPGTVAVSAFVDPNFCHLADVVHNCLYSGAVAQPLNQLAPNANQNWPVIGGVSNNQWPTDYPFIASFWDNNYILSIIGSYPPPQGQYFAQLAGLRATNIVAYHGAPSDGQTCESSKPIGDLLGLYNNGSGQKQMFAANVNPILAANSFTQTNPGQYASNVQPVGWLYKDQGGHYWLQGNSALLPSVSVAVSAQWASLGLSYAATTNPVYVGINPPKLPGAETYASCWPDLPSQGKFS